MPSVNLSEETYEKLKRLAAERGRSPDSFAEDLLAGAADDDLQRRWDELLTRTRGRVPDAVPPEVIEADVAAAVSEARAESRAGGR